MAPRLRHYRAPTLPLLTAWARHLDAVMRERDLSQTNVFDLVRDELGYATTSRTALRGIFSDKQPDERQAAVLTRHFGAPAPEPVASEIDAPDLVSAIREQNNWMRAYVERTDRRIAMLEQLVMNLSGRPLPDPRATGAIEAQAASSGSTSRPQQSDPTPGTR